MEYAQFLQLSLSVAFAVALIAASVSALKLAKRKTLPSGLKDFIQMAAIVFIAIGIATLAFHAYEVWLGSVTMPVAVTPATP